MGVALFIVPERLIEGFDHFVNGKALGRASQDCLDHVAQQAGVCPLMQFFSLDSATAEELYELAEIEPPAAGFPQPEWYSAEDGLTTVRGIVKYLSAHPSSIPNAEVVLDDLRKFEAVLARLKTEGVRWHLAVDG